MSQRAVSALVPINQSSPGRVSQALVPIPINQSSPGRVSQLSLEFESEDVSDDDDDLDDVWDMDSAGGPSDPTAAETDIEQAEGNANGLASLLAASVHGSDSTLGQGRQQQGQGSSMFRSTLTSKRARNWFVVNLGDPRLRAVSIQSTHARGFLTLYDQIVADERDSRETHMPWYQHPGPNSTAYKLFGFMCFVECSVERLQLSHCC